MLWCGKVYGTLCHGVVWYIHVMVWYGIIYGMSWCGVVHVCHGVVLVYYGVLWCGILYSLVALVAIIVIKSGGSCIIAYIYPIHLAQFLTEPFNDMDAK